MVEIVAADAVWAGGHQDDAAPRADGGVGVLDRPDRLVEVDIVGISRSNGDVQLPWAGDFVHPPGQREACTEDLVWRTGEGLGHPLILAEDDVQAHGAPA